LIGFGETCMDDEVDAIIVNIKKVDAVLLDRFVNLKYVCRTGVGLDMVDLDECARRNIKVVNTPGANADSVADICVWGILGLLRKTYLPFVGLQDTFKFKGKEVNQNTIAIFGFGAIGKGIYHRLKAFGATSFLIYDPYLSNEMINSFEYCEKSDDKDYIIKNSDIISLNLPLTKETHHFIGKYEFGLMNNDVIIANVARGAVIDEKCLIEFMRANADAGAYLDVWEDEPLAPSHELRELKNIVITPHIGAMTHGAYKRMHEFVI
ncbi:MAG: NAD(P)-dependent oxidoreductase, partial [Candidatus Gracilibacteria bacterium]|nr:NAD(P)-dependent oxidoreductase [Candidatus Gracilibacteria bacterium]